MAERKKGQGSEKRQRQGFIAYRTSEEAVAALRAAAAERGMSMAAYLRQQIEGESGPRSRKTRRFNPNWNLIADVRAELGHQGGNFNQLIYLQHIGDMEKPALFDEAHSRVIALCKRLDGLLDDGELW